MRLSGKVIIVTGGSRGIGEAIVRKLANEGARVFFTFNYNEEKANSIASEISSNEIGQAMAIKADVSQMDSVTALVNSVLASAGRIDGLVNNAGITKDNLMLRMSESDWDSVIDTNLKGTFLCCKAVCKTMMSQRSGRIINIGSIVGLMGNAGQANYSASKSGLVGLTKSLAKELGSRNILVNCIAPGYVGTDMTEKLSDEQKQTFLNSIPLRRAANASDIASVVAFFLSEDSAYITGQVLNVDGGLAM